MQFEITLHGGQELHRAGRFLPQSGQVKVVQFSRVAPTAASRSAAWISSNEAAVAFASKGRTSAGVIAPLAPAVVIASSMVTGVSPRAWWRRG